LEPLAHLYTALGAANTLFFIITFTRVFQKSQGAVIANQLHMPRGNIRMVEYVNSRWKIE
jgi:hypothetical protein